MPRDTLLVGVGHLQVGDVNFDNPTTMELTITNTEFTLPNTSTVGGGNYAKKTRIESITWTATVHDYSGPSLAKLLRGESEDIVAAAVASEPQTINANGLTATDQLLDVDQTVTITDASGTHATTTAFAKGDYITDTGRLYEAILAGTTDAVAPTFPTDGTTVVDGTVTWQDRGVFSAVAGTTFNVSAAGVNDLSDGNSALTGGLPQGAPVTISYTTLAGTEVNIATQASTEIKVTFDGFNEESNAPLVIKLHKNDVSVDGAAPFISEEYGALTIAGEAVLDDSQPVGKSRYGQILFGDTVVV